jgi:hypothetical protein
MTTTNGKRLKTTDRKTCNIDRELMRQVRIVAGALDMKLSECVEFLLRPAVARELAKAQAGRRGARKHGANRT